MDGKEILDLPMQENDAAANTIREYMKTLLGEVWQQEESFSGKRPFGNSGWRWDVAEALVRGGAITGEIDDDGLQEFDQNQMDAAVLRAIDALS